MTSACLIIKTLIWYENITQPASTHILGKKNCTQTKGVFDCLFGLRHPPQITDPFLPVVFFIWICINIFAYLLIGRIPDYMTLIYIAPTCLFCYEKKSACSVPATTLYWFQVMEFFTGYLDLLAHVSDRELWFFSKQLENSSFSPV